VPAARRQQRDPAISADINASADPADAVGDTAAGVGEVEMAAAGRGLDRRPVGQVAALALELGQGAVAAMAGVDVDHHQAGDPAGDDGGVRPRPAAPPDAELVGVGRRLLPRPPAHQRPLAGDTARDDAPAGLAVGQGGVQGGHAGRLDRSAQLQL
jgi:hypothetical protein